MYSDANCHSSVKCRYTARSQKHAAASPRLPNSAKFDGGVSAGNEEQYGPTCHREGLEIRLETPLGGVGGEDENVVASCGDRRWIDLL